jgi:opacity protein-like surface antigen
MKKLTCVLAMLAAASTAAVAKDLKQDKKATPPALTATQMGDDEMDKVTAGSTPSSLHEGTFTAEDAGGNANAFGIGVTTSGVVPGRGNITAASTPGHQP